MNLWCKNIFVSLILLWSNIAWAQKQDSFFPETLSGALEQKIQEALDQGLPTERIRTKAYEGAAKAIPEARIHHFLNQMIHNMQKAKHIIEQSNLPLSQKEKQKAIKAIGGALDVECDHNELQTLANFALESQSRAKGLSGAMNAWLDLSLSGYSSDEAASLMKLGLMLEFNDTSFYELVKEVRNLGNNKVQALKITKGRLQTRTKKNPRTWGVVGKQKGPPPWAGKNKKRTQKNSIKENQKKGPK